MTRFATGDSGEVRFQTFFFHPPSPVSLSPTPWLRIYAPPLISRKKLEKSSRKAFFSFLNIALFLDLQVMLSVRLTQKPIVPFFLPLLILSVFGTPTPFQPPHIAEITLALTARGDPSSLASSSSSEWTSSDNIWSTPLLNNKIPAAKFVVLGANTLAPSTENVDSVPGTLNVPTPEQEQQHEQQPAKLQKGENGCPTIFSAAVCDPGEGVTMISKAALPGFLNLDKCRQSMLSRLPL